MEGRKRSAYTSLRTSLLFLIPRLLTTNSGTGAVKESHSQYKHAVLHTHTMALMQWEAVRRNMREVAIFDSLDSNLQFSHPLFALNVRLHGDRTYQSHVHTSYSLFGHSLLQGWAIQLELDSQTEIKLKVCKFKIIK